EKLGRWEDGKLRSELRSISRQQPETNENQHKRFAQHIGPPRRGAPGRRRQKIYRTGDLACWLPDGSIDFLGRIDHQVKVRGFRVELGEIESQLLKHHKINEAVVVLKKDKHGTQRYLCAYFVSNSDLSISVSGLREYLSKSLPDYMIPLYFMQLEKIPLTLNGKVDRKALPDPEFKAGEDYAVPRNEIEEKVAEIWSEVLGTGHAKIGIHDNFFQIGGHSLKGAVVISRMLKAFNVQLTLSELFKHPTIRGLAGYIKPRTAEDKFISIEAAEEQEHYPLSSAQKRLYILNRMDPGNTVYNIPAVWVWKGELDRKKLEESFRKLIQRHESFRTSFEMKGDEPFQQTHETVEFDIKYHDLATEEGVGNCQLPIISDFVRPFDLSQAPLLRAGLIKTGEENYLLIVDMHHIISDGISIEIFQRELIAFYQSGELAPLALQYKDYSQWQNRELKRGFSKEKLKRQEAFWLKVFEDGEIPVPDLPYDFRRPTIQVFEGDIIEFEISSTKTHALKELATKENVTLFMLLLAIFYILLSKISNQEDIVVGTPTAGRKHPDLEGIIGMFVNTLALRNFPIEGKSFRKFLEEVKQRTLEAFDNQDYQFEDLVDQVIKNRPLDRNPLFDVMFALEHIEMQQPADSPLLLKPLYYKSQTSKFDMTLTVMEPPGGEKQENKLSFSLEYNTQLFKAETIQRIIEYFKQMLAGIPDDPGKQIKDIDILPGTERKRLLYDFNDTRMDYTGDKTLYQLFEEQVGRTPDHIALVGQIPNPKSQITNKAVSFGQVLNAFGGMHLTYRELNKASD
ncbi:MAG: hypothetical protein JSV88_13485, partial [Candidatus Aminicenantes bacterium]